MASVQKFKETSIVNQLRHIERTVQNPSNKDIDILKSNLNYSLSPDRYMSSYDYYKTRKSELYCYSRKDVNTMAGWIVTVPKDLEQNLHKQFFQETYSFLENRYGKENVISAIVHNDESGNPHLHFCFIPVVDDLKHGGEKICANDVLNRQELRNFHPDLQRYLKINGLNTSVLNGATANGNRTVKEMKIEREQIQKYEEERTLIF